MQKLLIRYVSILILISGLISSEYQNLVLIEFDNVNQNKYFDYLRSALPNKIKNYPFFNAKFNIEYAGSIEPYLDIIGDETSESVLLMGRFNVSNSQIKISYNIYDMKNWNKMISKEFFCMSRDEECITSSLLSSLNKSFSSLFPFESEEIDTSYSINVEPLIEEGNHDIFDDIYGALKNFAIEADLQYSWKEMTKEGSQFGDRYYKDIDSLDAQSLIENSKQKNTEKLLSFIDRILVNPYDVIIDEITFDTDLFGESIIVNVPVRYAIKKSLIEDFLVTIPHSSNSNKNGSVAINFSRSDYMFTDEIDDRFALMEYQVLPVVFLSDIQGKLSRVHIDSWKHKNKEGQSINDKISISDNFYPLFSITPGEKNLHIHLDMHILELHYNFTVSPDEIEKISKVAIKFLYEEEIDKAITNLMVNNE